MQRFVSLFILFIFLSQPSWATDFAQQPEVKAFINHMIKKHHFKEKNLNVLFNKVQLRPQVIASVKKPLEKKPWHTYQMLFVNEWRIQNGVKFWKKHAKELSKAEKIYGVPANIIVATIGVETKYGERTGDYRVIDSLASLGFSHSPRAPYFRNELEQFLLLTREQHLDPLSIKGSYAGAIGQPQFMPSSYRYYAVNFSKSGKIDLMHNEVDVIGSIANYYKKSGWKTNTPIATQALVIGNRYDYLINKKKMQKPVTLGELARYGVVPKKKIKDDSLRVNVIELDSKYSKEYWLGFYNFGVIKRYNPNDLYAMAVYQLSGHISSLKEQQEHGAQS